jgi:hypothetical protein
VFFVEEKLSRWARQAVVYRDLSLAMGQAAVASKGECAHVLVWDCTEAPVGVLVAKFVDGKEVVL